MNRVDGLLAAEGLELAYGDVAAVREVSFEVGAGEIVTLVGANGAGKSTTLRGIAGAMLPRRGRILFEGRDITRMAAHQRALAGIALVPEGRRVFPFLTVRENLEMGGFKYRADKAKVATLIERMMAMFPRLRERATQLAGTLSGGEQQMLAISRALLAKPTVMMLDEPSLGLSPLLVEHLFMLIRDLNREGLAILLVEQNTHMALATAHRGYVLELGRKVLDGTPQALAADSRLAAAYLGAA